MKTFGKGFSLIELMIVIAVVAILVTIAYPSYATFIRKAARVDAQTTLLDWAVRQALWRVDHAGYSETMDPPDSEYYTYSMVSTPTSFTLTTTAINGQANDKQGSVACTSLTVNHLGLTGPDGKEKCWRK